VEVRWHWLPAPPPHDTDPEQVLGPQLTMEFADWESTPPEQAPFEQVTVHESDAVQAMRPEHELWPQLIVQVAPAQVIPPEHEL
jgi:hypothetical protein